MCITKGSARNAQYVLAWCGVVWRRAVLYCSILNVLWCCAVVYSWRTGRNELKCALQERATCLAAHPNGMYIAAGSASGKLYVWELSSGLLLRTVEAAHYKAVSALAFSQPDGQFLVSVRYAFRVCLSFRLLNCFG